MLTFFGFFAYLPWVRRFSSAALPVAASPSSAVAQSLTVEKTIVEESVDALEGALVAGALVFAGLFMMVIVLFATGPGPQLTF